MRVTVLQHLLKGLHGNEEVLGLMGYLGARPCLTCLLHLVDEVLIVRAALIQHLLQTVNLEAFQVELILEVFGLPGRFLMSKICLEYLFL